MTERPDTDHRHAGELCADPACGFRTAPRALHPEHVPGQLDLIPVPEDLEAELARITAEAERLRALRTEHTLRAVSRVVAATAAAAAAEDDLTAAVSEARSAGATWEQIGRAAGMTRQSAHERWADR